MNHFEISELRNDKSNDNEQKGQRKTPRFSPVTHADQPSTSAVKEKISSQALEGAYITEKDYHSYQHCKDQILLAIEKGDAKKIIDRLKDIPPLKRLYGMSVGVWEGYTLEQHTSMVLEQFRKYQMENWNSSLLTAKEFQLMLAIHDIGKPQAVQETGKTSMQHEYNGRIIPGFLKWLGIPEEKSKLMVALSMQDHIGGFLQEVSYLDASVLKKEKSERVAEKISKEAAKSGIGVEQYFDLITCYYRADAGSYTVDAGGKKSLDFLFEKETAPNCTRKFAKQTQENYDILAEAVNRKKNQSLKLDDVMNWKKQKSNAYSELGNLLEKPRQGTLEVSKSGGDEKFETSLSYMEKLMKGVQRYFISEEKKQLIDYQREEKVEAVKEFDTHYKNIHIVLFAIEANGINKWVDSGKYLPQGHKLREKLQAKMQAVHSSLEVLDYLLSEKKSSSTFSREEKVAFFATKELAKLKEMKQAMEEIDQKEGGKKLGSRGKRALETMKKCYEHAEQISDHPHTLGALENSLKDVAKKLYALTQVMAREELGKAKELLSEVNNKKWDNKSIIKDIVADNDYAQYASQCFEKFNNQLGKCIDLNTKQYDKKAVEQLLTALKDLTDHHDEAIFVKRTIELANNLTGHHDGAILGKLPIELAKRLTSHHDGSIVKQVIEELGKARELSLEVKNNEWGSKSTLENIVEDKSYAEYAHQCFDDFNTQLEKYLDLFKGKKTPKKLLTALKDLTDHYNKVMTVKHVIELAQARKYFTQTRDHEAARLVRKALEKFEPSQHLLENYRKRFTKYWIKKSISKVDDKLICEAIDKVMNRETINKKSTLSNVNEELNMINSFNHPIDDSVVVFEENGITIKFEELREKWSEKEWFSKLDERQMLENGQLKEIVKEYYESYLTAVDKKVQDLVQEEDPQIWIRCQPHTLIRILECGRFKSWFETGTTGTTTGSLEERTNSEYAWAGIPHNMPRPFRFIYGYATTKPSGEARLAKRFGTVAVRLKPELKGFALQMLGDSGWDSEILCRPTFFDNADKRCFTLRTTYSYVDILQIQGHEDLEKEIPYQEVQIPAVYKEDIQEVVFHKRIDNNLWLKENLTKQLEQNAIRYRNMPFFQNEDIFQAAILPFYQKVLDISGKEIFTEDDYRHYQQYKEGIVTAIGKDDDVLLGSLQKIPFFEDLYGMRVERYSLQEHTSMVLGQFRKYQMENWNSSLLTAEEFQLMLAIHDIEKPQAVLARDKFRQYEYNGHIIPEFVKWLGIPEKKSKLIVALTMQDHLWEFLRHSERELDENNESWETEKAGKIAKQISDEAAKIGIGVEQYFDLITCYYRADAGSGTTDAGCRFGFEDFLFEKETAPNYIRAFSERTQRYYDILAEAVKSIASNKELELKGGCTF